MSQQKDQQGGGIGDLIRILVTIHCFGVIPYMRKRVGYGFTRPWAILLTAGIMLCFLFVGNFIAVALGTPAGEIWLIAFTGGFLVLGLVQSRRRYDDLINGRTWHEWHFGISRIGPMGPLAVYRLNRWQRYVEPLFCLAVGVVVMFTFSASLGGYLIYAGTLLWLLESRNFSKQLRYMLNENNMAAEQEVRDRVEETTAQLPPGEINRELSIYSQAPNGIASQLAMLTQSQSSTGGAMA